MKLKKSDSLLIFLLSKEKSEGMLLEVGIAKAFDKKIILLKKKDIKIGLLKDVADNIIEFESLKDLEFKFNDIR